MPADVRAAAGQPADRGLRGDRGHGRMRFGVVRFPGSCDEVDALLRLPALRRGRAALARRPRPRAASTPWWSPAASPTATTCAPGAIARFSPVMEAVIDFARDGGPVLGICNGFQVLCEAGLLPGRAAAQRLAALRLPPGGRRGGERRHARSRARARRASVLSIPVKHTTGRYYAPPRLDELEATQVVLRYAAGPEPQRLAGRHRGRVQRERQRDGADAPSRARGRPAHGLGRRREAVRVARDGRAA